MAVSSEMEAKVVTAKVKAATAGLSRKVIILRADHVCAWIK